MHRLDTQLVHAGEPRPKIGGAVSTPIFSSANFEYSGETSYHNLKYIRLNNTPNHDVLHGKLAAIEKAEAALVTASGMAAISTALLTVLKPGDHLLTQDCLYGGTHSLLTEDLGHLGIESTPVRGDDPDSWKDALRPNTRAFYVETLSNPLLGVPELGAVVEFCHHHQLVSMIDNTFASPINFCPVEAGYDLCLESATKYLNGHSDLVAGALCGRADLVEACLHRLNHLGATLDPHACFLLARGLKTLSLRVARQNENASRLAEFLEGHPAVTRVNYPGLASHPDHQRAKRWLRGFGGVLSFELAGQVEAAQALFRNLVLPVVAPSLGGVETLVTLPSKTSHAGIPPERRRAIGISDYLIRVAVGIEAPDDLVEDFSQALAS